MILILVGIALAFAGGLLCGCLAAAAGKQSVMEEQQELCRRCRAELTRMVNK